VETAGGAINSEGSNVTINGSTIQANTATADVADDAIFTDGGDINGTGNTFSTDASICAAPPPPTPVPVAPSFTG
jgi:hypothetical protein